MVSNYISEDFPLPRGKYERTDPYHHKIEKPKKNKNPLTNYYNNELPDFIKLDTMIENKNGYNNPFLDEVIKLDRSEQLKKMNFNRKQIGIIDFIKSKREYSQDPKILRHIRTDFDIEMQDKRERVLKIDKKKKKPNFTLSKDNEPKKDMFINSLIKLNRYVPKLSYITKKNIINEKLIPLSKSFQNVSVSSYDKDNIQSLSCFIDPKKSSYMKNSSNFNISDAEKNYDRYFHFERQPLIEYNAIKDVVEEKKRPPLINEKWESFYENYVMLNNRYNGYQRKGGYFTEFSNKNIHNINFQKDYDKEKKMVLLQKGIIKEDKKILTKLTKKPNKVIKVNNNIKQMPESLN